MWSNEQKALAVRAAKAAGLGEEQRRMILSGPTFGRRSIHQGRVTSTAPTLTHADFELYMSFVEELSPGRRIAVGGQSGAGFPVDHFKGKAADNCHRVRVLARNIAQELEAAGVLHPNGVGLAGWIKARVCQGEEKSIDQLEFQELDALIAGLKSLAWQRKVKLQSTTKRGDNA